MRTRAERKFVAKATALGARIPLAELFVLRDQGSALQYLAEPPSNSLCGK